MGRRSEGSARQRATRRPAADRVRVAAAAVVLCGAVMASCSDDDGGVDLGELGQTEVDEIGRAHV